MSSLDNYDQYIPDDLVKEIDEYEKKYRSPSGRSKGVLPSNEDIVNAIIEVTGGTITRHNINDIYDNVIKYLKSQGFNTSAVTASRVERLVSTLLKRGVLSKKL